MAPKSLNRISFQEREQKILKSATSLFAKNGFKGTTTKAIAQVAGINEALLFRHFSNKEKLYSSILKTKLEAFDSRFLPKLKKAEALDLPKALSLIATVWVGKMKHDQVFLRMMLYSALENHPLSRRLFQERLPFMEFLESFFAQRIVRKEIEAVDPKVLARAFFSLIYHYMMITQIFRARSYFPKTESEIIQDYVHIFLEGVSA